MAILKSNEFSFLLGSQVDKLIWYEGECGTIEYMYVLVIWSHSLLGTGTGGH